MLTAGERRLSLRFCFERAVPYRRSASPFDNRRLLESIGGIPLAEFEELHYES